MKRVISGALSIIMLLSLMTNFAFAVDKTTDERLVDITLKTKQTLGIGDEYTDFYGDLNENELIPCWDLNWSSDNENLTVEVTENGKVAYYYLSNNNKQTNYRHDTIPKISDIELDKAKGIAESFVKNLIDKGQTIGETEEYYSVYNSTYREQGDILINGLRAGIYFDVTVDMNTSKVIRFSQDLIEEIAFDNIPSSTPNTSLEDAKDKLRSTLDFELVYELDDNTNTAVLKYKPKYADDYYVDAQTGKLVNLTEIYREINNKPIPDTSNSKYESADTTDSIANAGGSAILTDVEKQGIEKMEGVLPKEQIESKLKAIEQLGINDYKVTSISYRLDKDTNDILAYVSLNKKSDSSNYNSKSITCNAKTCELISVSSWGSTRDNIKANVSDTKAEKTGYDFISTLWKDELSSSKLSGKSTWTKDSYNNQHTFTYTQNVNGIYLGSNNITVGIDVETGYIASLRKNWTYDVKFETLDNIVSKDEAIKIWSDALKTQLIYERVPVKISEIGYINLLCSKLEDAGYTYFYKFVLAYVDSKPSTENYLSIIAKTGETETHIYNVDNNKYYTDINGHKYESEINTLNKFGIGWEGTKCLPDNTLTQLDQIRLILSIFGNNIYYKDANSELDTIYEMAYRYNILNASEKDPNKQITTLDAIKMLLNTCGYRDVANLNIYNKSNGYIAIANGFGMIDNSTDVNSVMTRGEGLHLLYNFMMRK